MFKEQAMHQKPVRLLYLNLLTARSAIVMFGCVLLVTVHMRMTQFVLH